MSTSQATLFDLAPDYWYRLQEKQEELRLHAKAANTRKAYDHGWKIFTRWCETVGCAALPAPEQTVSDFVLWCLYERGRLPEGGAASKKHPRCCCYRLNTVRLLLSAIALRHGESNHPSPVTDGVNRLVRNAARDLKERKRNKSALTVAQLRRVCAVLDDGSVISTRDRAMILLQFAAGWRCSEVIGLEFADIRFTRKGYLVSLGASKTDQDGSEGRLVGIEYGDHALTCPVAALKAWINFRGRGAGKLFYHVKPNGTIKEQGLIGDRISERLKLALEMIGEDPKAYGSHSLRAGMVTIGIERGVSETAIMMRTGHKSLDTMRGYVRSAQAFSVINPMAGVL